MNKLAKFIRTDPQLLYVNKLAGDLPVTRHTTLVARKGVQQGCTYLLLNYTRPHAFNVSYMGRGW